MSLEPFLHITDKRRFLPELKKLVAGAGPRGDWFADREAAIKDQYNKFLEAFARSPEGISHNLLPDVSPRAKPAYTNIRDPTRFEFAMPRARFPAAADMQSEWLQVLAQRVVAHAEMSEEESARRDMLTDNIANICGDVLVEFEHARGNVKFGRQCVKVSHIGSNNDGFGMAGSDMDILLEASGSKTIKGYDEVYPMSLARILCMFKIGANFFTSQTGDLSVRGCEKPSQDLLDDCLKQHFHFVCLTGLSEKHREDVEMKDLYTAAMADNSYNPAQCHIIHEFFAALDRYKGDSDHPQLVRTRERLLALPEIPREIKNRNPHRLDLPPNGGIRFNLYLKNVVSNYNALLLRAYSFCDDRAKQMVIFVRAWARKRDICSPRFGTLSHYGYLLMVIHYCINIASPPVLPNLQAADTKMLVGNKWKDGHKTTYNGYDIDFWRDLGNIKRCQERGQLTTNTETVGSLLRGFFLYFSGFKNSVPPFHFRDNALCIKQPGGIVMKKDLGWTQAIIKHVAHPTKPHETKAVCHFTHAFRLAGKANPSTGQRLQPPRHSRSSREQS